MGLRLPLPDNHPPKLVITTTPKPIRALKALRKEVGCAVTRSATAENAANLSVGFLQGLDDLYGGTRRAAQELEGQILDEAGALFTAEMMAEAQCGGLAWRAPAGQSPEAEPVSFTCDPGATGGDPGGDADLPSRPPLTLRPLSLATLDRVIVAVDPAVTAGGDACGIVVAGSRVRDDGRSEAVVLADRSAVGLTPDGWARRVVQAVSEFGAQAVVAEVNQGGDMVESMLKAASCPVKIRMVRATRGKRTRAEPVAALYEQGRIRHAGDFRALEEELMSMGGEEEGSLDRADALVWAVTELLLEGPQGERGPRIFVI